MFVGVHRLGELVNRTHWLQRRPSAQVDGTEKGAVRGTTTRGTTRGLLLGSEDGERLVELDHGNEQEAASEQEAGPEERIQQRLWPIAPLV